MTLIAPPFPSASISQKVKSAVRGRGWPREVAKMSLENAAFEYVELDQYREFCSSDVPDGDAVIATWFGTANLVAMLPPSKGEKFYFVQGHEIFHKPGNAAETYKFPLKKIVVSEWLRGIMRSEYDEDAIVVPNTVDRNLYYAASRSKQDRPTIGFLYSSTHTKGTEVALEVLKRVKKRIPQLECLSFGAEYPKTRLPDFVEFDFNPSQEDIRELYSSCDVWLSCARTEGFNLTAMEAMACRSPLVSTTTGWPATGIIDGINGKLADVDDIDALVHGVAWTLNLENREWETLSEAAYRTMTTASWEESSRLFEEALLH